MAVARPGRQSSWANAALARGDQYAAAGQYLGALRLEAGNSEALALAKLSGVAKAAYEQKLSMAKGYRDQGNLPVALNEYKELGSFLDQLKAHQALNFVPINVEQAIQEVSAGAAQERYAAAESAFRAGSYADAIREYKAAMGFTPSYKDSNEKIAESLYRTAASQQQVGQFRLAAESYTQSGQQVAGYRDATDRAAAIYYQLGAHFLSAHRCRNAYDDLSRASQLRAANPDLGQKLSAAKECSTTRVAFVHFDNTTGINLGGMALGDVIFESTKTKMQARASEFIRLLDREQLMVLAREQRISAGVFGSETSVPTTLEGVDYLIFGKLNQVRDARAGLTRSSASAKYDYWYDKSYYDDKGRERTKTEWAEGRVNYTVYNDRVSVTLAGSIRVVEARTGAVVINQQIAEERSDQVYLCRRVSHPAQSEL